MQIIWTFSELPSELLFWQKLHTAYPTLRLSFDSIQVGYPSYIACWFLHKSQSSGAPAQIIIKIVLWYNQTNCKFYSYFLHGRVQVRATSSTSWTCVHLVALLPIQCVPFYPWRWWPCSSRTVLCLTVIKWWWCFIINFSVLLLFLSASKLVLGWLIYRAHSCARKSRG